MSEPSFRWMWHEAVYSKHGPRPEKKGGGVSAATLRAVCGALFGYMNSQGEVPPIRPEILLEDAGVSKPTMIACRAWLEEHGWIVAKKAGHTGQGWKRLQYEAQIPPAVFEAMHKKDVRERGQAALPGRAGAGQAAEPPVPGSGEGGKAACSNVVKQLDHSSSGSLFDPQPPVVVVNDTIPDGSGTSAADDDDDQDGFALQPNRSGGAEVDPTREAAVAMMNQLTRAWLQEAGRLPPRGAPDRETAVARWVAELRPLLEDAGLKPHEAWADPRPDRRGERIPWERRPEVWERALGYRADGTSRRMVGAVKLAAPEVLDPKDPSARRSPASAAAGGIAGDGWSEVAALLPAGADLDHSLRPELAAEVRTWCRANAADAATLAHEVVAASTAAAERPQQTVARFGGQVLQRIRPARQAPARRRNLAPVGDVVAASVSLTEAMRAAGFEPP